MLPAKIRPTAARKRSGAAAARPSRAPAPPPRSSRSQQQNDRCSMSPSSPAPFVDSGARSAGQRACDFTAIPRPASRWPRHVRPLRRIHAGKRSVCPDDLDVGPRPGRDPTPDIRPPPPTAMHRHCSRRAAIISAPRCPARNHVDIVVRMTIVKPALRRCSASMRASSNVSPARITSARSPVRSISPPAKARHHDHGGIPRRWA